MPEILITNPRILQSSYYNSLSFNDQVCEKEIKDSIIGQNKNIVAANNPITYACCGKLLLWAGDTLLAKKYLENAILLLPNLIEPRYNLSLIEYSYGDKTKGELYMKQYKYLNRNSIEDHDYNRCIDETYYYNFQQWYGVNTSSKEVIFY